MVFQNVENQVEMALFETALDLFNQRFGYEKHHQGFLSSKYIIINNTY